MKPRFGSNPPAEAEGRVHPLDWAQHAAMTDVVEREMHACVRRRRRRLLRITSGGALTVLMLLAAGLAWQWQSGPGGPAVVESRFQISSPARQVLPDGSVVELRGAAQITVDYAGRERRVSLREGEAHFDVAKDDMRPFVVSARGIDVRAVGTAFVVHLTARDVEVLVTEGEVAVKPAIGDPEEKGAHGTGAATPTWTDLRVEAGRRVRVDSDVRHELAPAVQPVSLPELAELLAWRVPMLEFHATPLAEVLPVFNRHANVRVFLADPELGDLRLSGVLRADNVAVLVRILESSYGVKADWVSADDVALTRAR